MQHNHTIYNIADNTFIQLLIRKYVSMTHGFTIKINVADG